MKKFLGVFVLLVLVGCAGWYFSRRGANEQTAATSSNKQPAPWTAKTPENPAESPSSLETEGASKSGSIPGDAPEKEPVQNFGRAVPVKADASPQAASVNEALRTKQHPERLSAMFTPKPFDQAVFEADPAKYLNESEPGRCYQSAAPGKDVPVLTAQSPLSSRIKQGESIKLTVKCAPLAPFSVSSFDGGAFAESKLSSVTVRADREGVASVTFVATPGTLNDCRILGASPLCSGQTRFVIEIEPATNQTP